MTLRSTTSSCAIVLSGILWFANGVAMDTNSERRLAVGFESTVAPKGVSLGLSGTVTVLEYVRVGALFDVNVASEDRYEEQCTPPELAYECVRSGVLGAAFAELHPLKGVVDPYLGGLVGWANREVQEHPRRNDLAVGPVLGLDAHFGRTRAGLGARYLFYPTLDANVPAQRDEWLTGIHVLARASYEF